MFTSDPAQVAHPETTHKTNWSLLQNVAPNNVCQKSKKVLFLVSHAARIIFSCDEL